MALLKYLRSKDSLPDPKGSLSTEIPERAISSANQQVRREIESGCKKKTRGPYNRYDAKTRAKIGKYACHHGTLSAARHFRWILGHKIGESTVHSIKKAYEEQLRECRKTGKEVESLPKMKLGRPLVLGTCLDAQVQLYLKNVREGGGPVTARIAVAAARGIMLSSDATKSKLREFGGHISLNRHWAYSLLERMNFVKRKATTAQSKYKIDSFKRVKESFLAEVITIVQMEEIPPELILNFDQTGVKIVPSSTWTMDREGSRRVEVVGIGDKRMITAVFCGSLVGDFLPVQVIYKGKTNRVHPHYQFPMNWHITHSENHWSTEVTMIQYVENIIIPYVNNIRGLLNDDSKPALVIMDNFKGQTTSNVLSLLESNDIHVCMLPPNTTDRLQPMDISINRPAKSFLKAKFEEWYALKLAEQLQGSSIEELEPIDLGLPILKELGAKWLVEMATYISRNPQFIVNGFVKAGISRALDRVEEGLEESDTAETSDDSDSDVDLGSESQCET